MPTTTARLETETEAFFSVGKAQATALARPARKRLARPITAFCSWITVGTWSEKAASMAGSDG